MKENKRQIYLSGKFENKEGIRQAFEIVRNAGFEISYDWTTHDISRPYRQNAELARQYAQSEFHGIETADIFIIDPHENGHTMYAEFGTALALKELTGKPEIYIIGSENESSTWFFNPHVKRCDSLEEALTDIK